MCNLYTAFGLVIHPFLPLPALSEGSGEPDVVIESGNAGELLPEKSNPCAFVTVAPGRCLQELPGHGRILVTSAKIVVEQFPGADDDLLRLFLIRSSFGVLMQLRGCLVLRGSAVEIGGKGVVITASACTGASTLAATLVKRGARLISDELCVIRINPLGRPELLPFYPGIHLWRDMAKAFDLLPENAQPVRKGLERFHIPLRDASSPSPLPVSSLFFLMEHTMPDILLEPVAGLLKTRTVATRICGRLLIEKLNLKQSYFKGALALSSHCPMWRLSRPSVGDSREKLAEAVEENR